MKRRLLALMLVGAALGIYSGCSKDEGGDTTQTTTTSPVDGQTNDGQGTVNYIAPTGISLTSSELMLEKGGSQTLTATVAPDNATNKTVTWTSSNTSVATVDNNGKVTAIAKGTATITAATYNGKTTECQVTVSVTKKAEKGEVIPVSCATNGKLPGKFSVSATKQVQFSQGNLQYQASTSTWRFGEAQYSVVGTGNYDNVYAYCNVYNSGNSSISASYSGWIDLFGWGTSGYNNTYPYMTSTSSSDYGNGDNNIAGTEYDWGMHNAISNGGNQKGLWRTLTKAEWKYLFNTRTNASSKYGMATVSGISGVVILPDSWTLPSGLTFKSGEASNSDYAYYSTVNEYTAAEWQKMENAGAVFLPASGYRLGSTVYDVGYGGRYWSSSYYNGRYAYRLSFRSNDLDPGYYDNRYNGYSVRLATE